MRVGFRTRGALCCTSVLLELLGFYVGMPTVCLGLLVAPALTVKLRVGLYGWLE